MSSRIDLAAYGETFREASRRHPSAEGAEIRPADRPAAVDTVVEVAPAATDLEQVAARAASTARRHASWYVSVAALLVLLAGSLGVMQRRDVGTTAVDPAATPAGASPSSRSRPGSALPPTIRDSTRSSNRYSARACRPPMWLVHIQRLRGLHLTGFLVGDVDLARSRATASPTSSAAVTMLTTWAGVVAGDADATATPGSPTQGASVAASHLPRTVPAAVRRPSPGRRSTTSLRSA